MDGSLVNLNGMLIGHQIFDIPVYQRSYAWERKNLEDLWEDLYYMDPSKKHYFGTMLLKDSGKTAQTALATLKRFDVIDGQQRLTTILILLREIISQLKEVSDDQLRGEVMTLEKSYLKDGGHYKLNPLGDDGEFFHHVIMDGNDFLTGETDTLSQRRLVGAKTYFKERLVEERDRQPSEYQRFLVQMKGKVDGLQLIQYQVTSDADAIRMFETVNDRGRPLTNLEKTKSFLMHTSYLGLSDEDEVAGGLDRLNGHFSGINKHFEAVSGTRHLERLRLSEDDVHRYHFISYISPGAASSRPLDDIKDRMRWMLRQDPDGCVEYALNYAKDLERAFLAVKSITDAYKDETEGGTLSRIFMMERVANIFPLLITAWLRFGKAPERMRVVLELLEAFIMRVYLVCGSRSNTGESGFHGMAHRVHGGELDYDGLVRELKEMNRYYVSDDRFERTLRSREFYHNLSSRSVKHLLMAYEIHLRAKGDVQLALTTQESILSADYEVEHIWAQHPSTEMQDDELAEYMRDVHRLGNLTIASKSWNISMGNKLFGEKRYQPDNRPCYANSNLMVQNTLAAQPTWNTKTIGNREDEIVAFALRRWSV